MPHAAKELYEFSRYRLDVAERVLTRDGKRVALADKAFDTLCVLVRNHGRLVGKDELMGAVWPDSVVEENNLDQKISSLRGVLGDKSRNKEKFIETVRGHGYRFLPQVRKVEEGQTDKVGAAPAPRLPHNPVKPSLEDRRSFEKHRIGNVVAVAEWQRGPSGPEGESKAAQHREAPGQADRTSDISVRHVLDGKRVFAAAVVTLLVIAAAGFAWWLLSNRGNAANTGPIDSVVVLPFVNAGNDPDAEYLSDGISEALINNLAEIRQLRVVARTTAFRYKGREIDPQTVGRELGVRAMLTGRVTQAGDRLDVQVDLIDTATGAQLWGETYHRTLSDMLAVKQAIAHEAAARLRVRLTGEEKQDLNRPETANAEAYQFYLQGLYHWNKRNAEDIRKSISLFDQAIEKDPSYARAYAGLASAYLILPEYSHRLSREEVAEIDAKRRDATGRAQALDDSLAEVHALLATIKEDEWDFAGAEQEYLRAIELNPNFASAHHWYSRLLGALGQNDAALTEIQVAHKLDPFSPSINFNVGGRLADARRFDEAIAQYKRVLEMEPNHPLTHYALSLAYEATGKFEEAIASKNSADVLLEKDSNKTAERKAVALTRALRSGGTQSYWRKRLDFAREEYNRGFGRAYAVAVVYARLGDRTGALEFLEKSFTARELDLIYIKSDSAFDGISSDPRFTDLLQRIGLPL